ncbi:hypothetical protein FJZ31_37520 [Candidatus Poribacteria bacterium]|nr:hypothetical protein [Candidatus Poribacteria bacterium]
MNKKILIYSILLLLWFSVSKSDAEEWRTYTVADGLRDNVVNAVAVDDQAGVVWFGTSKGASRFDGANWQSFLDGRNVQTILVEATNTIWFGTDKGVFLKEGSPREIGNKSFLSHRSTSLISRGERITSFLPDLFIHEMALDQQGVKWFATGAGIRSTKDGAKWQDYHKIELNLVESVLRSSKLADELSKYKIKELFEYEIRTDDLKYVRTSVDSIAIDQKDGKWLATHIIFESRGKYVVVSGIGFLDNVNPVRKFGNQSGHLSNGVKWELLESTVEVEGVEKVEEASAITSIALDKDDKIWYSRAHEFHSLAQGAFFFDGKEIKRYFTQDINQNGIWDGGQAIVTVQDLNGDGREEVVATADGGYDLQPRGLYLYDLMSGKELWQYRVGAALGPENVVIGDVTGDGIPEIVASSTSPCTSSEVNGTDDAHGFIFIWDKNGKNLWGNGQSEPLTPPCGQIERVALADLDKDGVLDIIAFLSANLSYATAKNLGGIIVTDGYGKQKAKILHHRRFIQGGVADLNHDGALEIVAIDDQGLLMIFDNRLSLLHQQQFEVLPPRLVAIADLYGDGFPEILLCSEGRLFCLDSQWTKGELATLWEYRGFQGQPYIFLSDIEQGGATEILIMAEYDVVHILSYDAEANFSLKSQDTGCRYWEQYSLSKTAVYPHAPSAPLEPKPYRLKRVLHLKDMKGIYDLIYTGDVNNDGALELISTKDNFITVWEYNNGAPKVLWKREYPNEREGPGITALEYIAGEMVILTGIFRAGHSELLVIDARNGEIIKSIKTEAGVIDELRNNKVNEIKVDKSSGEVWFATAGGVSTFDGHKWQAFSTADGLADKVVNDIVIDTSNNVWFATTAGVTKFDRTIIKKSLFLGAPPTILLCDDTGVIWSGTSGDGIRRYEMGEEKPYFSTVGDVYEVPAFAVDLKRNVLWVSRYVSGTDMGLYKINPICINLRPIL